MSDKDGAPHWLSGGGHMATVIQRIDWGKTPLGRLDGWPQSLRTAVSLCLASSFPISIAWGAQFTQIYNDGYWPICGAKHPKSMGQDFRECWAAPWAVIGESFEKAVAGKTSFLENQRMFLDRNGYIEETCFTFSFSPIRDESGGVGGLFHPVTETTATMLSTRRARVLRDLSTLTSKSHNVADACAFSLQVLQENRFDVPYVFLYLHDEGTGALRFLGSTGMQQEVQPGSGEGWPLLRAWESGQAEFVDEVAERFPTLVCGPYDEPPKRAVVLPLAAGAANRIGVMVAGISTRSPLDETYQGFLEMVASGVSGAIAAARAYEQERHRAEQLAEIDRAKTVFFSNVSHEFRTPLTLILGPAEDLLQGAWGALTAEQREQMHVVHRNTLRLLRLVNTLLDFSRLEANRIDASFEPVDLAPLTTDLASGFRAAIERAGMVLRVNCPPLPEEIYIDRDMWEKIVLNLVSNAFKYTMQGTIEVSQTMDEHHLILKVQDTGIGIPEGELGRVFERFHRVAGVHGRTHEGTGIGLALVRELVRLHGGEIEVQSTQSVGSVFTVQIPRGFAHLDAESIRAPRRLERTAARSDGFVEEALRWLPTTDDAADMSPAATNDQPTEAATPRIRKHVLVADDNSDMSAYVCRLLRARYDVTAVSDGEMALEMAQRRRPDLILSDVMMPVMDGFELLQAVRSHPTLHTIPMILLSARAGDEARAEGIESGADDYLTKPFSARELLARVQTQLSLAESRQEAAEHDAMQAHVEKLQNLLRARDEFLCVASHELKTPLTSLTLQLQMFKRRLTVNGSQQTSPERMTGIIDTATLQVSRLTRLVDDMLDVSRIETGGLTMCFDEFDLADLVDSVLERMAGQIAHSQLPVEVRVPRGIVVVWDRLRIEQVFINLLINAIRYGGQTTVEISARRVAAGAEFSVRDHGKGISVVDRTRIFERFERATRASEQSGLGLGLYIAKQIISLHHGVFWVESEPGCGADFKAVLPLVASRAPDKDSEDLPGHPMSQGV